MHRLEHAVLFAAFFALLFECSACSRSGYGPPLDNSETDTDLDGGLDADTADTDVSADDGSDDEADAGTDADVDVDADAVVDECPDDDQKTLPGVCGCGVPEDATDTDGDGTPDCIDQCPTDRNKTLPGVCGCGVPEDVTDTDGDGTPDCIDQCPTDRNKALPGVCGCLVSDMDTDSDSTPDCIDPDDDGDLWSDLDEIACGTDPLNSSSVPTDANHDGICDEKQFLEHRVSATDVAVEDYFGYSVSVSGDGSYMIVGAIWDDDKGSNSGSAFVFQRSGTTWSQQAKLIDADGAVDDSLGYSVSISSDGLYVIVGAVWDDDKGGNSGSAFVFQRSGTTWSQQAKLTASDAAQGDEFGYSVSISSDGSYVIVGANADDDSGSGSGSAYIFQRSGTTWSQQAKLTAPDGAAYDWFSESVSISGDGSYVVVGSYLDDDRGENSGSAYIFLRSGTTWSQQAKLTASDAAELDWFGESVSISSDGSYLIVGARYDNDMGTDSGSAYIFERSGTTWSQQAKLTASDGAAFDEFGNYVSISSDGFHVIVGALLDDDKGVDSGSAYVFQRSGTTWSQQAKLTASDGAAYDWFGGSVSISSDGSYVIVGAHLDDDKGSDSGSVYIY